MSFDAAADTPTSPPAATSKVIGVKSDGTGDTFNLTDFLHLGLNGTFIYSVSGANALDLEATGVASPLALRKNNTSGAYAAFYYSGSPVGSISTNGSSTAYNTTSDYRLKEDLQSVSDPIARLMKLKPVNFKWKAGKSRTDGFLAHEVARVVPDAVHGKKDGVDKDGAIIPQGLDQSKLVPLLVAALQAAVTRIEALEAKISGDAA